MRTGLRRKFPANREINREFCGFRPSTTILVLQMASKFNGLQSSSLCNGTGNLCAETGNVLQRTGNFRQDIRERCRPTASQVEAALSLRLSASECTVLTFAPAVRSDGIRMSLTPGYPGIALTELWAKVGDGMKG
jgi:hypothetical protein